MRLRYRLLHLCASARVINDADRKLHRTLFELLIARGGREEFRSDLSSDSTCRSIDRTDRSAGRDARETRPTDGDAFNGVVSPRALPLSKVYASRISTPGRIRISTRVRMCQRFTTRDTRRRRR